MRENTGCILLKDKKVMIFYTNDLTEVPRQDVRKIYYYSLNCVKGLAPFEI